MKNKMKFTLALSLAFLALSITSVGAQAFECRGPLSDAQANGFNFFFSPAYSPGLRHIGGRVTPENMKKPLKREELDRLATPNASAAATTTLTATQARILKGWLNENAQETVPSWVSTAVGIAAPAAWIGLSADMLLQAIDSSGSAGRIALANIAGTVSEGGKVAILHRITSYREGRPSYVWLYAYSATLNNQRLLFVLRTCQSEVVVN
jgi:hypothetical protein